MSRYGRDDALARLRVGITRLNESHGTVNSATGGYHETVTRAYAQLLAAFAARHGDKTVAERVTALLADPLADKKALLRFYSRAAFGVRPKRVLAGSSPTSRRWREGTSPRLRGSSL